MLNVVLSIAYAIIWHIASAKPPDEYYRSVHLVEAKTHELPLVEAKAALCSVLSKQSGLSIKEADWAFANPNIEAMIDRYDYAVIPCSNEEQQCYQLTIQFNAESIATLMNTVDISAWHEKRPTTLMWILEGHGSTKQLITGYHPLAKTLVQQGQQRALEIIMPNGDITDHNQRTTTQCC